MMHRELEVLEEDRDSIQINLLLADASHGIRAPFTTKNRLLRIVLLTWLALWRKLGRIGRWISFRLWKRRLIDRGRARWQLMAGIGNEENAFHRPEKIGYIDYPMPVWVKNKVFRDYIERPRPPKPDFE